MKLRTWLIVLVALAVAAGPLALSALAQDGGSIFIPLLVYRTGPYAPSGIPIANGFVDYFTLVNERDGGINGVKIAWEECETQYDTKQGVECYERLKAKNPVLVNPYSHGHHLPAHSQGPGGQGRRLLHGLRDDRCRRRALVPLGVRLPHHLLEPGLRGGALHRRPGGRAREAEGQEDRPHLPQQPLRQGSEPDARGAGEEVRVRADPPRGGSPRPGAEVHVAAGAPTQPRLDLHVRLGRDEPGGGEGSGLHRVQDGSPHRQLVVGQRLRRGARRRRRQGLQGRHLPRPRHQLPRARRHRQARVRQGQGRGQEGSDGRAALQSRRRQRHVRGGGHPHRDGQVRQQVGDRRGGALGLREPQPHRPAPGAAGNEGLHPRGQGDVRGPRGQRPRARPAVGRQEVDPRLRLGGAHA